MNEIGFYGPFNSVSAIFGHLEMVEMIRKKIIQRLQVSPSDRWMACDFTFTSFSIEFQSYQDDGCVMMKDCGMGPGLQSERCPQQAGLKPRTARSVGQCFTYWGFYHILKHLPSPLFIICCSNRHRSMAHVSLFECNFCS